jgi:hypothetical protein
MESSRSVRLPETEGIVIPFPCTTPDCDNIVAVSESAVRHDEWFDPADVICRDCADELIPDDVKYMRPASAPSFAPGPDWEESLAGYESELDLDLFGKVSA